MIKGKKIGIFLRGNMGESNTVVLESASPYETALRNEVGVGPDEKWVGVNETKGWIANKNLSIDISDKTNWDAAADWLHKHLHIYRRILTQSP